MSICQRWLRHSFKQPFKYYSPRFLHSGPASYDQYKSDSTPKYSRRASGSEKGVGMNEEEEGYQNHNFSTPHEAKGRRTRPAKWQMPTQHKSPLPDTDEKQFFKDLLDSLLDGPSPSTSLPKLNETSTPMINKGFSKIEQQLRDMALNPRPSAYRSPKSATPHDSPKRKYIRDSEETDEMQSLWHEPVQQRDAVKDEEFRELGKISELKTGLDLSEYALTQLFQTNTTLDGRYPKYLAATIKQASNKLQDPYLALSIFQQAKTRGVESYIAGCTTSVYNTILSLRWEHWKDVYGMHALIHEMISNGVSANDGTRRLVQDVVHEMDKDAGLDDVEGDGIKWSVEQRHIATEMRTAVTKFIIK